MYLITEHKINKTNVGETANRNTLNCNYCHIVHHINRLKKNETKYIIISIDAEKACGKKPSIYFCNISANLE